MPPFRWFCFNSKSRINPEILDFYNLTKIGAERKREVWWAFQKTSVSDCEKFLWLNPLGNIFAYSESSFNRLADKHNEQLRLIQLESEKVIRKESYLNIQLKDCVIWPNSNAFQFNLPKYCLSTCRIFSIKDLNMATKSYKVVIRKVSPWGN